MTMNKKRNHLVGEIWAILDEKVKIICMAYLLSDSSSTSSVWHKFWASNFFKR